MSPEDACAAGNGGKEGSIRRLLAIALVGIGASLGSGALAAPNPVGVHRGCPTRFSEWDVRLATVDQAMATARLVALDHIVEHNQGRTTRRTRDNYPVLEAVELDSIPPVPGQTVLLRQASRRCGKKIAQASWAVVFTDTESVLCCLRDVRFVVWLKSGWWIY